MPQIEEIIDDDIDNKHFDLEEFDSSNPFSRNMPDDSGVARLRPTENTMNRPARSPEPAEDPEVPRLSDPGMPPIGGRTLPISTRNEIPEHMKEWSVIYPVYFDARHSRAEGRRVPQKQAVNSPLATNISDACKSLGYSCALELTKGHPQDWANPGRVRVDCPSIAKRKLYSDISDYLKSHPANEKTARVQMYSQMAQFDSIHPLAVPRGMKIGNTLPGISPALSARKFMEEDSKKLADPAQLSKMFGGGM